MKMKLMALVVLLSCMFSSLAYSAEELKFSWSYDPIEATEIDGFRLYRDGNIVEKDGIPPSALTVSVPRQEDKLDHSYHIVAYIGDVPSLPSNSAIVVYSYKVNAVGSFTVEIIK